MCFVMKRSLCLLTCITLAICFSACSEKDNESLKTSTANLPSESSVQESSSDSSIDINELHDESLTESSYGDAPVESSFEEGDSEPSTIESERAYDQLNKNEQELIDAFFKGIGYFKNPASVRLVYAHSNNSWDTEFKEWDISVIAQNSFGGNTETDLELKEDGTMTKPLVDHVRIPNDSKYRLDLLNKAIAEYVKEKYAL